MGEFAPLDLAAEELRLAAEELGRITGRIDVEELLGTRMRTPNPRGLFLTPPLPLPPWLAWPTLVIARSLLRRADVIFKDFCIGK